MTLAEYIESEAAGEQIIAVTIGTMETSLAEEDTRWRGYEPGRVYFVWAEARVFLNHEWDHGYGGADCPPVLAWTATKIIGVHEYDGATGVASVPRDPTAGKPSFLGC